MLPCYSYTIATPVAAAILGGYSSLVVLAKIRGAMKGSPPPVEEAPAAAAPVASTGIPDVNSPEFATYVESDAFMNLLNSEEQLGALCAEK